MATEITFQPGDKVVADQWDADFTLKSTPDSGDTILGNDSATGNPCKFKMSDIQAAAATNILGVAHPSDSPSGAEVNGQGYDVSNTSGASQTFTNFLDSNGDPIVIPDGKSGVIRKSGGSWEFVETVIDVSAVMAALGLSIVQSPEFLYAIVDADQKILFGIRIDGSVYSNQSEQITMLQSQIGEVLTDITFIESVTKFFADYQDPEERMSLILDQENKILSYRDNKGKLHENGGLETPQIDVKGKITFTPSAMSQLQSDLKAAGFSASGRADQSDAELVQLPFPKIISYLNFDIDETHLPNSTDESIEVSCNAEYWDQEGNYFKKPVKLSTQGDSSLLFYRKNFSLDVDDGSTWKFGNYCDTDGFHLKGYYEDAFRGREIMAMRLFKEVINSRPYQQRYAFYEQYQASSIFCGNGDLQFDSNSVAKYVPDGFPVAIYCNGVFYGCYCLKYKKERDNMDIKKKNLDHVWIDGTPGNGKLIFTSAPESIDWTGIPVKSPSGLKDIDGNDYDDDFPKELSDTDANSLHVKNIIKGLSGSVTAISNETTTEAKRNKFLEFFDLNSLIDFYLFSNVIYNFDIPKNWQWYTKNGGEKWALALWDVNLIFGIQPNGNTITEDVATEIVGIPSYSPLKFLTTLFASELLERYTQLRQEIFTTTYIVDKLKDWLNQVTFNKLSADLDKWPETPSYRDGKINRDYWECIGATGGHDSWDENTSYSEGDYVTMALGPFNALYSFKAVQSGLGESPVSGLYENRPYEVGFYESVDRVKQVINTRLSLMDNLIGYSN